MLYLANPANADTVAAMRAGLIGCMDSPLQGNRRPTGVTWAADNGCFSAKWDPWTWWHWLWKNHHDLERCMFAVAPDVVGDHAATYEAAMPWMDNLRGMGYPVAYVAQNGLEERTTPWSELEGGVLFIGGDTAWKLGPEARELAGHATARGIPVHVGRINSDKRWRYAAAPYPYGLGATSADGTFLTYGPRRRLPELLGWARHNDQPPLPLG